MTNIIGTRISARMSQIGTNATQAALDSGLGKTAVRDIIAGKSKSPTIDTLARLSVTLGCSIAYLIGETEDAEGSLPGPVESLAIEGVLRVGAFLDDEAMSQQDSSPANPPNGIIVQAKSVRKFRVKDNENSTMGVLYDDLITVASPPPTSTYPLLQGTWIVVRRRVQKMGISELSLRRVQVNPEAGTISLTTTPNVLQKRNTIELNCPVDTVPADDTFTDIDGNEIKIEGLALYLARNL